MFVFVYIFWIKNVFQGISLWYSDAKITLKNVYCVFVVYFVVFTWAPSTRSSSEAGKALWFFFLLFFFPRVQEGGNRQTSIKILGNFFTISLTVEMFSNCAGRHRKRDVTTMFTYSHLNTPIDQWERAYYLKYFIKCRIPYLHSAVVQRTEPQAENWVPKAPARQGTSFWVLAPIFLGSITFLSFPLHFKISFM